MRGEWIEIVLSEEIQHGAGSLSPCGESGLKLAAATIGNHACVSLSPCGESGLKSTEGERAP